MEQSIRQLVVEDEEIDDPAILNVSKNCPIPKVRLRTILTSQKNLFYSWKKKFDCIQGFKNIEVPLILSKKKKMTVLVLDRII